MNHDHPEHHHDPRTFNWVLWGFIGIAAFFLISEHRAHLYGFLPYALLLACPLMHLFGHGHGHHHRGNDQPPLARDTVPPEKQP